MGKPWGHVIFYLTIILMGISCQQPAVVEIKKTVQIKTDLISLPDTSRHLQRKHDSLLRDYWNEMHRNLQYSGVTLLVKNDTFFTWHAGIADSLNALRPDMPMQIASLSKPFCSAGMMWLIHHKKIALTDTLRKFYPELPYYNITIEDLLSHSSGLPEYVFFTDHEWENKQEMVTNLNLGPWMATHKPQTYFKPHARHRYTNTNYVLLACIIEKISGMRYPQFMQKKIFGPLGMKQTRVLEPTENFHNLPVWGHYGNAAFFGQDFQDGTYGDKNIISTAWDLYRFYLGLKKNVLFPDSIKRNMYRPRWYKTRAGADYALGWRERDHHGNFWIFHTGWWHGFRSNFYFCEEKNWFGVTLSNRLSGGFIYGNLLTAMFDEKLFEKIMDELKKPGLRKTEQGMD